MFRVRVFPCLCPNNHADILCPSISGFVIVISVLFVLFQIADFIEWRQDNIALISSLDCSNNNNKI